MKRVLVNVAFRDAYTNEVREAGKNYPMTEERVKEIKEVNPNFITVLGDVVEETKTAATKSGSKPKGKGKGKNSKEEDTKTEDDQEEDTEVEDVEVEEVEAEDSEEVIAE